MKEIVWKYILTYLDIADQFNYSLSNKSNLAIVLNYWYGLTGFKLETLSTIENKNNRVFILINFSGVRK